MENSDSKAFLFDICKEVKHFYETPVIFLNHKDYSDIIFNTMCNIRAIVSQGYNTKNSHNEMIDCIVDYHIEWLRAVGDIEAYQKHINEDEIDREEVYASVSYTIDALAARVKYFKRYMDKNLPLLTNDENANMHAELEIIEDMHKDVTHILHEKLKCFRDFVDETEFKLKVMNASDELLQWVDKINDGVSMALTKYVSLNIPHLTGDLTKTLQQIVDDLQSSQNPTSQKMLDDLKQKGNELSTMIRYTVTRDLEISKVVEKINVLEDRITRLESEPTSAAVMALQHKKDFLERRLASLENLKTTIKSLHGSADIPYDDVPKEELCICEDFFQLRIFNHALPPEERERLVTELCYLWDLAVFGEKSHKSIISILSAAEMKEKFEDDLGIFFVDDNNRKIYKLCDDETLYQPNENNELVPLSDDKEHIFYYDECGRYYISPKTRQRVYKAHATASEYMMDTSGVLLKVKEVRDGVTYHYDSFGRYYVNDEGKHIYRDVDAISEYENDGLGNLVRIRSHLDLFEMCPDDAHVTEDFKYLKQTVGPALQESIAAVIMNQPADPIKYLSTRLMKFRENIELKQKRFQDKEQLEIEREFRAAEERTAERAAMEAALFAQGGSETSYDSNLLNYASLPEDKISASSK